MNRAGRARRRGEAMTWLWNRWRGRWRSAGPRPAGALGGALLLLALGLVACGGDPDTGIDADAFIRAPVAETVQPSEEIEPPTPAETDAPADAAPAEEQEPAFPADDPNDLGDLDLAEDILRRYLNDTYGFSLELVCGAFCDVTTNGVDRVVFVSNSGRAFIDISVLDPESLGLDPGLNGLEAEWLDRRGANPSFAVTDRRTTVLASDGQTPGLLLEWEVDARGSGGDLLRVRSLIVQVGPLGYFVETGAASDEFGLLDTDLQRAQDSFIARAIPPSRPGLYGSRFGFLFPYNATSVTSELGTPLPTFDLGLFEQRTPDGILEFLLRWETVNAEFFDPEEAVSIVVAGLQGAATDFTEVERSDLALNAGVSGRAVIVDVAFPGVSGQLGVFAWYCQDTGRSFVLQSLSPDDVRALAQPSLDGFRCAAE